jgi:multisubunit Na+/H+ antiporter MnhC subunit
MKSFSSSKKPRSPVFQYLLAGAATCFFAAGFAGNAKPVLLLTASLVAFAVLALLLKIVREDKIYLVVLGWALLWPLGYYFLQIPRQFAIITWDRCIFAFAAFRLLLLVLRDHEPVPVALRRTALLWAGFLLATLVSMRDLQGKEWLGVARLLVEAFVIPGVLALYVLREFPVTRHLRQIHAVVCIISVYLAMIGIAEVATGTDLLAMKDAGSSYYAGSTDVKLLRANGPFGANGTYATVGLINFLLLVFLRKAMGPMVGFARMLHGAGLASSVVAAFIPLFRALVITAFVIFALSWFRSYRRGLHRWWPLALASVCLIAMFSMKFIAPDIYHERVEDPANVYGRLAEVKQVAAVIKEYPVFGVGLYQFYPTVSDRMKYLFSYKGESSLDYPHSTPLAIAAETGLVGALCFFAAQLAFVLAVGRILKKSGFSSDLSWDYFLYIFIAFWGMNIDLISAYYDELNIWYMFALAIVNKYGIEQGIAFVQSKRRHAPARVHVPAYAATFNHG